MIFSLLSISTKSLSLALVTSGKSGPGNPARAKSSPDGLRILKVDRNIDGFDRGDVEAGLLPDLFADRLEVEPVRIVRIILKQVFMNPDHPKELPGELFY